MLTLFNSLKNPIHVRIQKHHELYPNIPVKAEYWESMLVGAINDVDPNIDPQWTCGSQQIGRDIVLNSTKEEISCKSGQIHSDGRVKYSSSSLSRFGGDACLMKTYLQTSKTEDFIFCLSTYKNSSKTFDGRYLLYYFPYDVVNYSSMKWDVFGKGKDICGVNSDGVRLTITQAMGWQVWYYIPINLAVSSCCVNAKIPLCGPGTEFFQFAA